MAYSQTKHGQKFFFLTVGYDGLLHSFPVAGAGGVGTATRGKISARFSGEGSRQQNKARVTIDARFPGQGSREVENE